MCEEFFFKFFPRLRGDACSYLLHPESATDVKLKHRYLFFNSVFREPLPDFVDFDGDDSDKDRNYIPSDSSSDDSSDSIPEGVEHVSAQSEQHLEPNAIPPPKPKTRKRRRNPASWKSNIRKEAHAAGKTYLSVRNKTVPAKRIKTTKDCQNKCIYKCQNLITENERENIFIRYYTLDEHGKKLFLLANTKRFNVERHRKNKTQENSRRKQTFTYYFEIASQKIQVCKTFFLNTLSISQTPVYTAHKKDDVTNIPDVPVQGKHIKRQIPEEALAFVKIHIESFPCVESHYCRANTKRNYLDSTLNIKKMYELYTEACNSSGRQPVKQSFYRSVFCSQYNLHFHVPKKDRCDLCEEVKMQTQNNDTLIEEKRLKFEKHLQDKVACREEKKKDRDTSTTFLVFDMQNVITCPHAEVSNFYYKSKLNVYNLTAILSSTKQVYCALWHEGLMGRSGNDLASALIKILDRVFLDNPNLESLVLWSDSCVPQNRNSLMSTAISLFINEHPNLNFIIMKFSTPGHSCNQEIDAVHSCIERLLNKTEFYSPVSLLRILLKVHVKKPYVIIQLKENDFKDYKACASLYNYKVIPFSQVVALRFTKSQSEVQYKISHAQENWNTVSIRECRSTRSDVGKNNIRMQVPSRVSINKSLPENKVQALKSMFKWMPEVDRTYYTSIFPK